MADSSNYYDEESDSGESHMDTESHESDTPEEKMGLVPLSFFKNEVKPGDTEKVKVMSIQDGEAVIKCVYSDKDDKDEGGDEEPKVSDASAPSEAEDPMMA